MNQISLTIVNFVKCLGETIVKLYKKHFWGQENESD